MHKVLVGLIGIAWLSFATGAAYADQTFEQQAIIQPSTGSSVFAPVPPKTPAPSPPQPPSVPKAKTAPVQAKPRPVRSSPSGDILARIRMRESGGNYKTNTGNGYYGAYQFDVRTWNNYGGYKYASDAPPAVQDAKAADTYARRGCHPWPNTCY